MDRVFLDANVLFSAAYKPTRLRTLWTLTDVTLVSSSYAVAEALTNLDRTRPDAVRELKDLLQRVIIVKVLLTEKLPPDITLVEKDRPILIAAISVKASHLLTGDKEHFGHLFGLSVEGVLILTPAQYPTRVTDVREAKTFRTFVEAETWRSKHFDNTADIVSLDDPRFNS